MKTGPQQLDFLKPVPEWLTHLRTCPQFLELDFSEIPLSYWRASLSNEAGVCVGHWYEEPEYWGEDTFQVLIMYEDGKIYAYYPMSLFPAPKPEWVKGYPNDIETQVCETNPEPSLTTSDPA